MLNTLISGFVDKFREYNVEHLRWIETRHFFCPRCGAHLAIKEIIEPELDQAVKRSLTESVFNQEGKTNG